MPAVNAMVGRRPEQVDLHPRAPSRSRTTVAASRASATSVDPLRYCVIIFLRSPFFSTSLDYRCGQPPSRHSPTCRRAQHRSTVAKRVRLKK